MEAKTLCVNINNKMGHHDLFNFLAKGKFKNVKEEGKRRRDAIIAVLVSWTSHSTNVGLVVSNIPLIKDIRSKSFHSPE